MNTYPSMKAKRLLAALSREPCCYRIARQSGSHRRMVSERGYPPFTFAFHDGDTIGPRAVRKVLEKDVGLTPDQAAAILGL